jgi:hypothetical protein
MQQRTRRLVRRQVGPIVDSPVFEDSPALPVIHRSEGEASPRGRRRRGHFADQLEAARQSVGFDDNDARIVRDTQHLIDPHVDVIAQEVYAQLLCQREAASYFVDDNDVLNGDRLAAHRAVFREWLGCLVHDAPDASTAQHLASIGQAYVRPRDPIERRVKARHLVRGISHVQTSIIGILTSCIAEPQMLSEYISAWCKLLTIHVDVLLAVYASAAGSAHWY